MSDLLCAGLLLVAVALGFVLALAAVKLGVRASTEARRDRIGLFEGQDPSSDLDDLTGGDDVPK